MPPGVWKIAAIAIAVGLAEMGLGELGLSTELAVICGLLLGGLLFRIL